MRLIQLMIDLTQDKRGHIARIGLVAYIRTTQTKNKKITSIREADTTILISDS